MLSIKIIICIGNSLIIFKWEATLHLLWYVYYNMLLFGVFFCIFQKQAFSIFTNHHKVCEIELIYEVSYIFERELRFRSLS